MGICRLAAAAGTVPALPSVHGDNGVVLAALTLHALAVDVLRVLCSSDPAHSSLPPPPGLLVCGLMLWGSVFTHRDLVLLILFKTLSYLALCSTTLTVAVGRACHGEGWLVCFTGYR